MHTFGEFDLKVDGETVDFPRAKVRELLAYLIDRQGYSVSRANVSAVLFEEKQYRYLMSHAVCRLEDARETFRKSGMDFKTLIHLGGNMWALFPWLGSYAFLALERFLKISCGKRLGLKGLSSSRPYYMQFTMQVSEEDFYRIVREEAEADIDPMELVYPKEVPVFEKYDEYVPEELIRKGFAYGVLDMDGMKQRVMSWSKFMTK